MHSDEESNDAKRARVESAKKQRLNRISQEYLAQIRAVRIADDVFHTMDEYQSDLRLDDHDMDDEWYDETEIAFGELPICSLVIFCFISIVKSTQRALV